MGNTPDSKIKNNSTIINIELGKIDYFKGETILGEIILNVGLIPLSFHQINISLNLKEGWYYETGGEDATLYSEKNEIVLKTFQLNVRELLNKTSNLELITLNQGKYYLPFNYKLSTLISPSLEYYMASGRGYLRYFLTAELISPYINSGEKNEIYEKLIIVKSHPKILKTPLVYSVETNVKKWGLLDKGNTKLYATYYKNYGVFDEMIPITVTVDNTKGDLNVTLIKIVLIRNINFLKYKSVSSFYFKSNVIELKSNVSIKKECKETFNYQINLRDSNLTKKSFYKIDDPYSDIIDLNYLLPTVNGNLVRCEYVIKISCEFESLVTYNNRPRVFLPLNIGHQGKDDINDSFVNYKNKNEGFINMEEIKPENDKMFDDFVVVDDNMNENKKENLSEIIGNNINPNISKVNENVIPLKSMGPLIEYGIGKNNYEQNNFNQNNGINYHFNQYQNINYKNNNISYDNQNNDNNYKINDNQNNYYENNMSNNLNDNLNNNLNNNQNNTNQNNICYNLNNNQNNTNQNNIYYNTNNNQNNTNQNNICYNTNNNQNNTFQNNLYYNTNNYPKYNSNNIQNNSINNDINNVNYSDEKNQIYNQNNYSNNNINFNSKQNYNEENNSKIINEKEKILKNELKANKSNNIIDDFLESKKLDNESIDLNSNGFIEQFLNAPYPINNNNENSNNENS